MKITIVFLILFAASGTVAGQTVFQGLTPGKSTRADVDRVLGKSVKNVSKTLVEYASPDEVWRLYVQYRDESPTAIVERIERTCLGVPSERCRAVVGASDSQLEGVLEDVFSEKKDREDGGTVVRYYGAPRFIVSTHIAKGINYEARLAFYSKELYESVMPKNGCTGTIFGTWQTERGRMTVVRVGDSGIQGTYSKDNGTFSLKRQGGGGYVGEWKDDTGSGTMALMVDGDSFSASLSRGSAASASRNQPPARSKLGSEIEKILKTDTGAAVGPIITEPSGGLSRITGLPPGDPLTGKCVP